LVCQINILTDPNYSNNILFHTHTHTHTHIHTAGNNNK